MAWVTPTAADLRAAMTAAEVSELGSLSKAQGQADVVTAILAVVVDLVRGYVRAYRPNLAGPEGTIPAQLLAPAMDIAVVRLIERAGEEPSQARARALEQAMKLLADVAAGRFVVETGAEAAALPIASASPSVSTTTRDNFRANYDGL